MKNLFKRKQEKMKVMKREMKERWKNRQERWEENFHRVLECKRKIYETDSAGVKNAICGINNYWKGL